MVWNCGACSSGITLAWKYLVLAILIYIYPFRKMTSLRCWLQPPMLDLKTVRQPWNNTSSRGVKMVCISSTWRRLGKSSCWPLVPSQPLKIPLMFSSSPPGLTVNELSWNSLVTSVPFQSLDVSPLVSAIQDQCFQAISYRHAPWISNDSNRSAKYTCFGE